MHMPFVGLCRLFNHPKTNVIKRTLWFDHSQAAHVLKPNVINLPTPTYIIRVVRPYSVHTAYTVYTDLLNWCNVHFGLHRLLYKQCLTASLQRTRVPL